MNKLNFLLILILFVGINLQAQKQQANTVEAAQQASVSFKVATWNTEWLSCNQQNPTDDLLQVANVATVIKSINPDVIALQEVGTSSLYPTVDTLVRKLGSEWGGFVLPADNSNCGQNQAVIYKKAKVQLVSNSFITSGGTSYDWSSGRYPVLYTLNFVVGSDLIPVSFINIHAKAMSDATSYSRRKNASTALKTLLDGNAYNAGKIILLGDYNDYLTGTQCSSCSPADSPYKNFVDDTQNYKCLTQGLYDPNYSNPVIDNVIISNELVNNYVANSAKREVQATQSVSNYYNTTSDHVPVSCTFTFTNSIPDNCTNLSVSESFAQNLGSYTQYSVSGAQVWYWRQNYGACISGYSGGVANTNEDWLISPAYDLTGKLSAEIKFSHAINFAAAETDRLTNHTLWVSDNYSTDAPSAATWTKLTIPTMPSGSDWIYVNSGSIYLPTQYLKNNVRLAFKYLSGTSVASTWEIKDLTLDASCVSTGITSDKIDNLSNIYLNGKKLMVENKFPQAVKVYNIMGNLLLTTTEVYNAELTLKNSGVYIVRVGNAMTKIFVR